MNNDIVTGLIDAKSFTDWIHDDSEDSSNIVYRLKVNLRYALQHELIEKQRTYLLDYFANKMTLNDIAAKYGVDRSTVSRTLMRARKNLLNVLQYTDKSLLGFDFLTRINYQGKKNRKARKRR